MIAEFIDPAVLGFILVGVMLFAIFVGFPISFTLIFLGFVFGYLGFGKLVFYLMTLQFSMVMTEQTLAAVPLFVFMGVLLEKTRIAESLLTNLSNLLGHFRGGLAITVVLVGMLMAASTGIVGATVVTMGMMSLPIMMQRGYDPSLATGTIAATGTLGQIIPPSIALVLLGDVLSNAYQQAQHVCIGKVVKPKSQCHTWHSADTKIY